MYVVVTGPNGYTGATFRSLFTCTGICVLASYKVFTSSNDYNGTTSNCIFACIDLGVYVDGLATLGIVCIGELGLTFHGIEYVHVGRFALLRVGDLDFTFHGIKWVHDGKLAFSCRGRKTAAERARERTNC